MNKDFYALIQNKRIVRIIELLSLAKMRAKEHTK